MSDFIDPIVPHPLRIGFGASGAWAQSWFPAREAIGLIERAYEAGVRHFDTAGFYNNGQAEQRLAIALRGCNDVMISTKTGTRFGQFGKVTKDFSIDAVRRDLDASLQRLGRERVDCFYLHGPEDWVVSHTRPTFIDLKSQGLIARAGVCGEGAVLSQAIAERKTDAIMTRYHLFDRSQAEIFNAAKLSGIHTVAIAVLGQALYRKGLMIPRSGSDVWALARAVARNRNALRQQRVSAAQALHRFEGFTAAQLMIGYVLSNPAIDVAMTTTTRSAHLVESTRMARANGLDEHTLSRLIAIAGALADVTN